MKKLAIILGLAMGAAVAQAQPSFPYNVNTITDPTGLACPHGAPQLTIYPIGSKVFMCGPGDTLISIGGGGSGTVTSVTGTANQIDVATGTTTPILSLSSTLQLPTGTTLVAPVLGTPASGVITNLTGTCTGCNANIAGATAQTISVNGAASVSPLLLSGSILTGGTATTNFPALFIQPTGTTAVTSWNTNGCGICMNLPNSFAGTFLDLRAGGGGVLLRIQSDGAITSTGANGITDNSGPFKGTKWNSASNCASAASPAVCAAASAGFVVVAAAGTTVTVNTTAVTASSQIFVQEDSSLGTALSVTCNTTPATAPPTISARTAATSFVITTTTPAVNPRCFSYDIVN